MTEITSQLQNSIRVAQKIVTGVEERGTPWGTVSIRRITTSHFICNIGRPSDNPSRQGTLEEVLEGFDPSVRAPWITAFSLSDPTEYDLESSGLYGFCIIRN
jgi:hypothetical protein